MRVFLTEAQARMLHEVAALVLNDPDWPMTTQERNTLYRADLQLISAIEES